MKERPSSRFPSVSDFCQTDLKYTLRGLKSRDINQEIQIDRHECPLPSLLSQSDRKKS